MRFLAVLAVCLSMFASPSHAAPPDCDASREGTIIYNKDRKLVQFCNGDDWIGMVAKIGGTGDTLSDLTCQNDEVPVWNGAAWVCGTGGGDSLWSDSGQGYLIYDGEKGVKLANITGMAAPELSIGDFGCNANEILKWDGDSWECAADASGGGADNLGDHIATTVLRSDTNNTDDLGTTAIRWKDGWFAGTVTGGTFAGSGASLTSLNASNLGSGTVPGARMPALTGDVTMAAGTTTTAIAAGVVGATELATDAVTNVKVAADAIGIAELSATGTASSTTFLRGDNTWSTTPAADNLGNHIATTVLRSDTNNTDDLGTSAIRWNDGWFGGTVTANQLDGPWDSSASGYIRLGDLQIAWGIHNSNTSGGAASASFPAPFVDANYKLVLTPVYNSTSAGRFTQIVTQSAGSFTAQSFTTTDARSGVINNYIAIGRWR